MPKQPKVLLISSDDRESNVLEKVLSEHVVLTTTRNLLELEGILDSSPYDAVFCGWSFSQATWNTALEQVRKRRPDLPVIIFCGAGGEREWVEVLDAGGFDFLAAPYHRGTVLPVLEHAVASLEGRQLHKTVRRLAATV